MAAESEQTSLKGLFQSLVPEAVELMQGTVISTNPLKIQMDNDSKLVISESSTIVPRALTDYQVEMNIQYATAKIDGTKVELEDVEGAIALYNHLDKGNKVHVMSIQNGKKYFVLDRV